MKSRRNSPRATDTASDRASLGAFAARVYAIVRKIPAGRVITYQEVARRAGSPRAYRAVGTLMRKNAEWPRIPCHRVVRSDGSAGNWSGKGGRKKKIALLRRERAKIG